MRTTKGDTAALPICSAEELRVPQQLFKNRRSTPQEQIYCSPFTIHNCQIHKKPYRQEHHHVCWLPLDKEIPSFTPISRISEIENAVSPDRKKIINQE
jgi:hypothetical protein